MPARLRFGRKNGNQRFTAFHEACDANNLQLAADLLLALEDTCAPHLNRGHGQGEKPPALLQAQARLWSLRCRIFGDAEDQAAPDHPPDPGAAPESRLPVSLALGLSGHKPGPRA